LSEAISALATTVAAGTLSAGTNGYQIFPSGLIIQWGESAMTTSPYQVTDLVAVTFPIEFPTGVLGVLQSIEETAGSEPTSSVIASYYAATPSGFYFRTREFKDGNQYLKYHWFAIGY